MRMGLGECIGWRSAFLGGTWVGEHCKRGDGSTWQKFFVYVHCGKEVLLWQGLVL